jgi:uncharacterized membrane protein YhhN
MSGAPLRAITGVPGTSDALPPLVAGLLAAAAVLAVAAILLGDRGARGLPAPGVRIVKTSVPAVLLAAVLVAWVGATGAGEAGPGIAIGGGDKRDAVPGLPALSQLLFAVGMACTVLADWWLAPVDNSETFVRGLAAFLVGYLLYAGALWWAALAPGITSGGYVALAPGVTSGAGGAGLGGVGLGVETGAGVVAIGPGPRPAPAGVEWQPLPVGVVLGVLAVTGAIGLIQSRTLTGVASELRGAVSAYMVVATLLLAGGALLFGRTAAGAATGVAAGIAEASGAAAAAAPTAPSTVATLLFAGTALIYLSDSLIAHNIFRRPLPREELWIMPTYYLGQGAVALALVVAA